MTYHWYICTQPNKPTDYDKLVGGVYGYESEPADAVIDKHDLRKVSYETFSELTERYF